MTGNTATSASGALDADDLQSVDLDGLRRRWRNLSGKTAAPDLTRALLQRLIAYEQQVVRFGGLTPDTERMLTRIAAEAKGAGKSRPRPVSPAQRVRTVASRRERSSFASGRAPCSGSPS